MSSLTSHSKKVLKIVLQEQLFALKLHNRKSILTKAFFICSKGLLCIQKHDWTTNTPPNINMYMSNNNMSLLNTKLEKTVECILSTYYTNKLSLLELPFKTYAIQLFFFFSKDNFCLTLLVLRYLMILNVCREYTWKIYWSSNDWLQLV